MNLLVKHATQADGIQPQPLHLRPRIGIQVELAGRVEVHMAIQTTHAEAGLHRFPVVGRVEFLLRELRNEHAQSIELCRRHQPAE